MNRGLQFSEAELALILIQPLGLVNFVVHVWLKYLFRAELKYILGVFKLSTLLIYGTLVNF